MASVHEIKTAIESLPHHEFMQLMNWIHQKDIDEWDTQLEGDVRVGKLDFLVEEALTEEKNGSLRKI